VKDWMKWKDCQLGSKKDIVKDWVKWAECQKDLKKDIVKDLEMEKVWGSLGLTRNSL
jgi:hypothetical protein